jgi:Ca2+-binding RTX toxin-like protein
VRRVALSVLVAGLLSLPALPANAAVTCQFFGLGNFLTINVGADSDFARIRRQSGGDNIEVRNSTTAVTCGGPTATVHNTNLVIINDNSPGGFPTVEISMENGPLAPGMANEPGSSDEIEIDVNGGGAVHLIFRGSEGADRWTFGTKGANLNAAEGTGVDRDLTYSGIGVTDQNTLGGPDVVDGRGGDKTGDPFRRRMQVNTLDGADRIFGGRRDDSIRPEGTTGSNDRIDGGKGRDDVNYVFFPGPIRGDLGRGLVTGAGRDRLVSIEGLFGSDGDDVLIGAPFPDLIWGNDGDDVLRPVSDTDPGQVDAASGALGTDTVSYSRQARRVVVDLDGPPIPYAEGPSIGFDQIFQMENAVGGRGNDRLDGSALANRLVGGAGSDRLFGQAGPDALDGGRHRDECDGGTEIDTFLRCEEAVQ